MFVAWGLPASLLVARRVSGNQEKKEKRISSRQKQPGDRWYRLRIQPYRTLDNVVEGAVITFVDISEAVLARNALHSANNLIRLAVVVRDASDAITVHDRNGHILAWNPGAVRLYGWSEEAALHRAKCPRGGTGPRTDRMVAARMRYPGGRLACTPGGTADVPNGIFGSPNAQRPDRGR